MASTETANVARAAAASVGTNIREVRTKLGLTQAQLAPPEFSISYISAIERGKIRPSLKALSILAKHLDVPLTFLLEGSPAGAAEARAVGYSPADSGPDLRIDVDLLQSSVLIQQQKYEEAAASVRKSVLLVIQLHPGDGESCPPDLPKVWPHKKRLVNPLCKPIHVA